MVSSFWLLGIIHHVTEISSKGARGAEIVSINDERHYGGLIFSTGSTITDLLNQIKLLKTTNKAQEEKIISLEEQVSDLEQYSRMNDVIVSGLKIRPRSFLQAVKGVGSEDSIEHEESTEDQVMSFLRTKDILVDKNSVEACHLLPAKKQPFTADKSKSSTTPASPAIILRFSNRKNKVELLKQWKKLKGSNVYVNEHLTKRNADIARKARQLRKQGLIQSTWTASCKVLIKTKDAPENARGLLIRNLAQLDKFEN